MTNYLNVEVASQRGYTQVKVNGNSNPQDITAAFKNAPIIDVLTIRVELLRLLQIARGVIDDTEFHIK